MKKYLYGASVQGIQSFIFEINELKSIVGASEIIKSINDKIANEYGGHIMVNSAGNIKLIFNESDKEILEDLVKNFLKKIKQNAFGITVSQAVVAFEEGGLKEALVKLERRLVMQRNISEPPLDMSINILKLAPKTARPMVEKNKDKASLLKEAANTSTGEIPKNKKNKTAIIHADGNGLGVMIANMTEDLQSDEEVIAAYRNFSTKLDEATQNAYEKAKRGIEEKDIREVILGGDDMTVICNADKALEFTKKFLEAFEEETMKLLGSEGLTACAGIAYCNHKFPFHYAVNLAEALCSYAKNTSREDSSVMFHNIQSANFTDYESCVDQELTLGEGAHETRLDYGPYFIKPKEGYATVGNFIYLTEAFKIKGSPISRLREWLTILGQDEAAAKERLRRINEMMDLRDDLYKKQSLEKCFRRFDENISLDNLTVYRDSKRYTPIGDVVMHLAVTDDTVNEKKAGEC